MLNETQHAHWEVHVIKGTGISEETEEVLGVHTCTKEEWKQFYEPQISSKFLFDELERKN